MKQECDYLLDKGELFLYGHPTCPHLAEVCTDRRCMGVKRSPSPVPALTCGCERSGRAARRPWEGNPQRAISASRAGPRCPCQTTDKGHCVSIRPALARATAVTDKRPGAERLCGVRCCTTALHHEGAPLFPSPSATGEPRRSQRYSTAHSQSVIVGLDPTTQRPGTEAVPCALGPRVKPEGDTGGVTMMERYATDQ